MATGRTITERATRVRPLAAVAGGLVLVALDFRTRSFDVLPDALGWLLVGAGAWMAGIRSAAVSATAAALLSLSELSLPYRLLYFDSVNGEYIDLGSPGADGLARHQRWDDLSQLRGAIIATAAAVGAAAVVLLLRSLAHRARGEGDAAAARALPVATVVPVLWACPFVVLALDAVRSGERYDPVWDGGAGAAGLVATAALLGLAGWLALRRDRGWAFLERPPTATGWRSARHR